MTEPITDAWHAELAAQPFEEVYRRLEETVSQLEQGELSLTDSERLYVQGMELANRCQQLLTETELRITQVGEPDDGRSTGSAPASSASDDWSIPPAPEPDDPSLFEDDDDLPF